MFGPELAAMLPPCAPMLNVRACDWPEAQPVAADDGGKDDGRDEYDGKSLEVNATTGYWLPCGAAAACG